MSILDEVHVERKDLGKGPVRWTERRNNPNINKGAALLGRHIGIYDFYNSYHTDIDALEDIHWRLNKFRELNIWTDNAQRKVKTAHSRICGDFPGIGRDAVTDPSVMVEDIRYWRDYQVRCLRSSQYLTEIFRDIWDNDFIQMGQDLGMPPNKINHIKNWRENPSAEARFIIDHAHAMPRDFDSVISEWRRCEDIVLALDGPKRLEEIFQNL